MPTLTEVTTLPGQKILADYRDEMAAYLITEFGVPAEHAALRIDQLWGRLVSRYRKEHPSTYGPSVARLMSQAIGFLASGTSHVPEVSYDPAWHLFMTYSQEYMAFCQAARGRYIHHVVLDVEGLAGGKCDRPCTSDCDMV